MGFRFRRRISIGPGLRLTVSKSGISTSVGTRGAWFTIGHGKTGETVGIPGTGVSYTEQQSIGTAPAKDEAQPSGGSGGELVVVVLLLLALAGILAFAFLH